jgi:hypothetical protein
MPRTATTIDWPSVRFWGFATTGTILIACLIVTAPLIAIALVAVPILAYLLTHPKTLIAVTVLATVFAPTLINATGLGGLDYADEVLVIASVVVAYSSAAIGRRAIVWLPGGGWFVVFLAIAALSGIVSQASFILMGQDAFLLLKGVLFAAAVAQLEWTTADIQRTAKIGAWLIGAIIIGAVVNLAIPGAWLPIFSASELNARGGVSNVISFFGHPSSFGQVMALSAIALLCYRQVVRKSPITLILFVGSVAGALVSVRRKAIIGLAVVIGWVGFTRKPLPTTLVLIVAAPIVALIFGDALLSALNGVYIEYFVNPDGAARTVLYSGSVTVANDRFPLGAGLSLYGTFVAASNYSPVYTELGFPGVWGLQLDGRFLTDTFWPAILGEGGWFGLVSFALGLIMLAVTSLRLSRKAQDPLHRWVGIVGFAWSLEFLLESVASPVYVSPPTNLLLFGLLGLAAALWKRVGAEPALTLKTPMKAGMQ